jgi:hypothetical protein
VLDKRSRSNRDRKAAGESDKGLATRSQRCDTLLVVAGDMNQQAKPSLAERRGVFLQSGCYFPAKRHAERMEKLIQLDRFRSPI